jgi:hypothetical protein
MTSPNPAIEPARRACLALLVTLLAGCGGDGSNPGGGGSTNHAPTITTASAATPNPVAGGAVVQLSVSAADSDGDTLTYTWSQTPAAPAGTFATQAASTTWTAPAVTSGTSYDLRVAVSDGHGGSAQSSAPLYVKTAANPSFAADVEPIFNRLNDPPGCTICHGASGVTPHLAPTLAWAAIVGVPATIGCTSQNLVEPSNPDASVIIKRITGTTCGARMPPGAPDYFDTHPGELATIRSWILAGALNN